MNGALLERLLASTIPEPNTGCALWLGHVNERGYGQTHVQGKVMKAHRAAWIAVNGPLAEGLCVLHRCDQPSCVRPDHLFVGTQAENVHDCIAKGRRMSDRTTHCPNGHPYGAEKTRRRGSNARRCATCEQKRNETYRDDQRAAWRAWFAANRDRRNAARRAKRAAERSVT